MPRPPIESVAELQTALAEAIPPQHRARAVSIGRMLLSALGDQPAPPGGQPAPPGGDPAVASSPVPEAAPSPEPEPTPPTVLDRLVGALKGELDQHGLALPQDRYRSRIPLVMRPRSPFRDA